MAQQASDESPTKKGPTKRKRAAALLKALGRAARSYVRTYRVSILGLVVIMAAVAAALVALNELGVIELSYIAKAWPTGYGPLRTTLILTLASFAMGFAAALPMGLARAFGIGLLKRPRRPGGSRAKTAAGKAAMAPGYGLATGYINAIRGTPFLIQMYLVFYFVLAVAPTLSFLGANVFFWIGLIALTLNTAGYQAEVFRAGFQSVAQGQIDAARSIGLRPRQVFTHVTLPQALRLVVLPLANEFISLLKASTIVGYIPVYEIFHWEEDQGNLYGHPIEGFIMLSLFYLLINVPLSRIVSFVERKKRISGLGTPGSGIAREGVPA